jgi:hypothetical protein
MGEKGKFCLSVVHFKIWNCPTFLPKIVTKGCFSGVKRPGVKLTNHLQLVPRSRKHGCVYPLPHMSSWQSAQLVEYKDRVMFNHFWYTFGVAVHVKKSCVKEVRQKLLHKILTYHYTEHIQKETNSTYNQA